MHQKKKKNNKRCIEGHKQIDLLQLRRSSGDWAVTDWKIRKIRIFHIQGPNNNNECKDFMSQTWD